MAAVSQPIVQTHRIDVPGSISNLGPGFDALSVAVNLYLRLRIVEVAPSRPGALEFSFAGTTLVGENRIARAFLAAHARFHGSRGGGPLPGLRIDVESGIPMRAGLGSSAAAVVAGLRLYEAMTSPIDRQDALAIATEIEGHPDNAAAALLGGLTLSCQSSDGSMDARSWPWPSGISFVVATPQAELETAFARKVLPETISLRDAVFNLQHALLFVRALESGQDDDLREALQDRWHQPHRQAFVPGLGAALAIDDPAVLGVCLSGSGPSIAALTRGRQDEAAAALGRVYQDLGVPYTIRKLHAVP